MKTRLRMKCPSCGHWNRVSINKIFVPQNSPEPKVNILIPMYEPLETVKCKKCRKWEVMTTSSYSTNHKIEEEHEETLGLLGEPDEEW